MPPPPQQYYQQPIYVAPAPYAVNSEETLIRRIADYERLSCWFWLILGIVQVICIVTIIAGIWNIFASISRWKMPDRIRQRDSSIPKEYQGVGGLVIIGLVNLFVGGIIGVAFIIFDFVIRDKVLSNAHLFTNNQATA
jgi:hypothetical protein